MSAKKIIECLLFLSDKPIFPDKVATTLSEGQEELKITESEVKKIIFELDEEYKTRDSGLKIIQIGEGFLISSKAECAPWIRKVFKSKNTLKLSQSALESLSIIAYKQPLTKAEIEAVRGVDAGGVLNTLLEKKLIRICGRKEVPGRPLLYATTQDFLRYFGLKNLLEMPSLEELDIE